jgi:hypothetical protein
MTEIVYTSACQECEAHKTELGTLKHMRHTIKTEFPDLNADQQFTFLLKWFEQCKLDERTRFIESAKQRTTDKIQQYKQKNMMMLKKEG